MRHIFIVVATLVLFASLSFSAAIQDSYSYSFTGLSEGSTINIPGGQFRVDSITVTGSSINPLGRPTCMYNIREVRVTTPNDQRTLAVDDSASMKYFTHANGQTKLLQVHIDNIQASSQNAAPNCNVWINKRVDLTLTVDSLFVCTDPDANAVSPLTQKSTVLQERYYATKGLAGPNALIASEAAPVASADVCASNVQVTEYSCGANGAIVNNLVNCAAGSTCQNGACIMSPDACQDSDQGNDPNNAGGTEVRKNGVITNYDDVCIDAGSVREYSCNGVAGLSLAVDCAAGRVCQNGACVAQAVVPNACADSDNGQFENIAGSVTATANGVVTTTKDTCNAQGDVVEQFCDVTNTKRIVAKRCAAGLTCQLDANGQAACTAQAAPNSCSDSDNGADTTVAGITSGIRNGAAYSHADTCVDADTVQEYQCFGANDDSANRDCAAGLTCQNGACVNPNVQISCTDSDNGQDEDERGTTRRIDQNNNEVESHTDICQDDTTVKEYFCVNDNINSDELDCNDDQVCSSGRCVDTDIVDNAVNGLYSSEYCAGKKVGLRDSIFYNNYEFRLSRIYEDVVRECMVAELQVYKNGERVSTIFGCPSENPYRRSNENEDIEAYVCGVDSLDEVAYLDVSVLEDTLNLDILCKDPDGGRDANERGTSVVATYDQDTGELLETHAAQDVCSGAKVREFYCSNDELKMTELSCGAQKTCQNGRCVAADDLYCSDSDGDDITVKGTAESGYLRGGQKTVLDRANDVCEDGKVRELVCNGDSPGFKLEDCAAGFACSDGACVPTTNRVEIQFKKGWNAFSVPLSSAVVKSTTCNDFSVAKTWAYSSSYYHPSKFVSGLGMWYYAASDCKATFEGNPYSFTQGVLSKGWNVLGFDSSSRPANAVFQECSFSGNVWKYDSLSQKYAKVDTLEKGSAYFVKVDMPCEIKG